MRYRLICVDLDGTLLTDDKRVSEQDRRALRRAVHRGVRIALVTGRMPAATELVAREIGIPCIMACNAGTYIQEEGQCLYAEYLSTETMRGVYEAIRPFGIPLWIFRDRQWFVTGRDRFIEIEERLVQYKSKMASVEELAEEWGRKGTGPNKVLVGAETQRLQEIHNILRNRQDADMACSTPNYLEIFPRGIHKGKALRMICERKGILREETAAFGDQELDIPMLEEAGIAVAMGNAVERLKETADFVTRTNNESGIAFALEHYLNRGMEE